MEASFTESSTPSGEDNRVRFVGLCGLYVFLIKLFPKADKRLSNRMLELCKKIPSVTLFGSVMWFPEQFLQEHLPSADHLPGMNNTDMIFVLPPFIHSCPIIHASSSVRSPTWLALESKNITVQTTQNDQKIAFGWIRGLRQKRCKF